MGGRGCSCDLVARSVGAGAPATPGVGVTPFLQSLRGVTQISEHAHWVLVTTDYRTRPSNARTHNCFL